MAPNPFIIIYMGRKMMIDLLLFESKKLLKRKNIIIIALLITLIVLLTIINMSANSDIERSKIHHLTFHLTSIHNAVNGLPKDGKSEKVKKIREDYIQDIDNIEKIIEAHKTGDWKKGLEYQIVLDRKTLNQLQNGEAFGGEPIPIINSRLLFNQELR